MNRQALRLVGLLSWVSLFGGLVAATYLASNSELGASRTQSAGDVGRDRTISSSRQVKIKDIRVGDRVFGENPELPRAVRESTAEPDWRSWRRALLVMQKPDGELRIELIRPRGWFAELGASPGCEIYLDMEEMGACGSALVVSLLDDVRVSGGPGHVVTATFAHFASTPVLDVYIDDDRTPLGVTDNHLFWAPDDRKFRPIGELEVGERIMNIEGRPGQITKKNVRTGQQYVYNLEVYGEHVYYVGSKGWLAHNHYAEGKNDVSTGAGRDHVMYRATKVVNGRRLPYSGYASAPSSLKLTPDQIVRRRYNGDFSHFDGGDAPRVVYFGKNEIGKQTARGLEHHHYWLDVIKGGKGSVANRQRPVGLNNQRRGKYFSAKSGHILFDPETGHFSKEQAANLGERIKRSLPRNGTDWRVKRE